MRPRIHVVAIFLLVGSTVSAHAQLMYPVVSKEAQRLRDEDRRRILLSELKGEREMLAKVQMALNAAPTQGLLEEEHRHSENVKALLRELDREDVTREVALRPVAKSSQSSGTALTRTKKGIASFWDPYNRAQDSTDFSTTQRKEIP